MEMEGSPREHGQDAFKHDPDDRRPMLARRMVE